MQESRAERADCAIRELNGQILSHRMEIYHKHLGHSTSRREQACFQAELFRRERVHQVARIKTVREVEEIERV